MNTVSIEEIKNRFFNKFKHKFDYSLYNEHKTMHTKIKIKCNGCKGIFFVSPVNHLKSKGCPLCENIKNIRKTTEIFIKEARNIHGDLYDYSITEYTTAKNKVDIKCNKCNNIFSTIPLNHTRIKGSGCPKCNKPGVIDLNFLKNNKLGSKEGILYSLRFKSKIGYEIFYKIGITSTTLEERFDAKEYNLYNIELLDIYEDNMINCYIKEEELKNKNIKNRYNPKNKFGGYSECYLKQIEI